MRLCSIALLLGSSLSGALAQLVYNQASVVEQLIALTTTTNQGCNNPIHSTAQPEPGQTVVPGFHTKHKTLKKVEASVPKPVVKAPVTKESSVTQPAKPLLLVKPTEHIKADRKVLSGSQGHSSTSRPPVASKPSPRPIATKPKPVVPALDPTLPPELSINPFVTDVLHAHNTYRWMHGEQPLQWNTTLQAYAHDWGSKCIWKHSDGDYGENLAEGYPDSAAKFAVKAWYDECNDYDFVNGKYDEEHGHCTQVLWTTTTQVGCANVKCDNLVGGYVLTCSYFPAGNIVGDVNHQTAEDIKFFNAHLSPLIHH